MDMFMDYKKKSLEKKNPWVITKWRKTGKLIHGREERQVRHSYEVYNDKYEGSSLFQAWKYFVCVLCQHVLSIFPDLLSVFVCIV